MRPFFDLFPEYDNVRVTTGWVRVVVDGETVLVIEDTQWGDEATFDVIRFLGRRIDRTNGVMVLTYRDTEVESDHPIRQVIGDLPPSNVERIHLAGADFALSISQVTAQIVSIDRTKSPPEVRVQVVTPEMEY